MVPMLMLNQSFQFKINKVKEMFCTGTSPVQTRQPEAQTQTPQEPPQNQSLFNGKGIYS